MKLDEHIDIIAKVGEVAGKEYAIEEVNFLPNPALTSCFDNINELYIFFFFLSFKIVDRVTKPGIVDKNVYNNTHFKPRQFYFLLK